MKENAYGIRWNKDIDPEKAEILCGEKFPILKEVSELALTKKDTRPDQFALFNDEVSSPTHLLIEGDNLHSLACLCYSLEGKIHIIYIDPPYNTGNKDFMYNDSWVDKDNKDRKSLWLSFMEKRLRQAKILLTEDGVIFISIDDNMLYELKLLCDEIFGPQNFVANLVWKRKETGTNLSSTINVNHEYVLCYAKNIDKLFFNKNNSTDKIQGSYKNPDNDSRGSYTTKPLYADSNTNKEQTLIMPDGVKLTKQWFINQGSFNKLIEEDLIYWTSNKIPRQKVFLSDYKGTLFNTSLDDVGTNNQGTIELKNILGKTFITVKPVKLIKHLINLHPNKNAIVLDFFAGSGTTGHAVLELNKEDNGKRQFILCTNNENNIMTDVCYPRIKKVMCGYKKPNGEKVEGLGETLKYFKTDFVEWHNNLHELAYRVGTTCSGMLRTKEGVYNELENNEHYEIYYQDEDSLIAIYKDEYDMYPNAEELKELKDIMNSLNCKNKILYIFSLDWNVDAALKEEFRGWKDTELKIMPIEMIKEYESLFVKGILKR